MATEEVVAIKIFEKGMLRRVKTMGRGAGGVSAVSTALDKVRDEIEVMRRLAHENVVEQSRRQRHSVRGPRSMRAGTESRVCLCGGGCARPARPPASDGPWA